MQGLVLMRETKSESIDRIVKLVEAINRSAPMFESTATAVDTDTELQQFAKKIHERVNTYEFELRNELQRLASNSTIGSHPTFGDLRSSLQTILESYQQALGGALTPHARAMINRQFEEIQRAHDEFDSIHRAA